MSSPEIIEVYGPSGGPDIVEVIALGPPGPPGTGGSSEPIPGGRMLGNFSTTTMAPVPVTAAEVREFLGVLPFADGDKGDIVVSGSGATWTVKDTILHDTIDEHDLELVAQSLNSLTSKDEADFALSGQNRSYIDRRWNAVTIFDYYVDPVSGNDGNAGTRESPFQTLAAAISLGGSVAIGLLRGTTTSGAFTLTNQIIGAYGDPRDARPIVTHNSNATIQINGSGELQNLDVRSTATGATQATVVLAGTGRVRGCRLGSNDNKPITISGTSNRVEDNEMVDDAACAQLCTLFQATNAVVERNTLTRTQTATTNGFFIHGSGSSGNVIQGNRLISTVGKTGVSVIVGMLVDSDFTDATPHVFRFNYVSGPWERHVRARRILHVLGNVFDARSSVSNASVVESSHGTTLQVHGNTMIVDGTVLYPILANNTSSNSTIVARNNIILATSGNPFYFGLGAVGCTYTASHNTYFGSTRTLAWNGANWATYGPTETGGVNSDPQLVDVAGNNFLPTATGASVNSGFLVTGFNDRMFDSFSVSRIQTIVTTAPNRGALVNPSQSVSPTTLSGYGITDAASSIHTHDASAIVAGTLDDARLSANIPRMVGGVIQASNLPSYVDDILEFANLASFPATGETGKIYVSLATNLTYRWSGSAYVELTDATAVWGQITGTLSNQTDLQNAINAKQETLVSGTNIRTVNGNSLLGSGDLAISGGIGGSTGATDNAVLRADGTGGATAQSSSVTIDDSGNVTATQYIVGGSGSASAPLIFLNGAGAGNAIGVYRSGFNFVVATQGTPVFFTSYTAGTNITRDNSFGISSAQFDATVSADTRWSRSSAGVWRAGTTANNALGSVELANLTASALIGLGAYTVATLPSASANAGRIAQVTDSSVTANGSPVAGGGANRVMVFSNGTAWDVVVA